MAEIILHGWFRGVKVKTRVWNVFKPDDVRGFRLANDQVVGGVGVIGIEVQRVKAYTLVVFGDEGVHLLGVTALEELGFEVDPIKGELKPMKLILM